MGAIQDTFASNSSYTRKMNEVELEKQRALQRLEVEKLRQTNENERERLELEKKKAKADFELKKGELLLKFQTDVRRVEAELIQTRMVTQSSLFEKFIDFMRQTLTTNETLITQKTRLYELANNGRNDKMAEFYMDKAESVKILSAKELIEIGAEKVKELNLDSRDEMKYLESRLEDVLGIMDSTNYQFAISQN
jgi:hypothetical protein